jgi:hypothetical protein
MAAIMKFLSTRVNPRAKIRQVFRRRLGGDSAAASSGAQRSAGRLWPEGSDLRDGAQHAGARSRTMPRVIARLLAIILCMAAGIAGVLWVSLELADAVSEGADGVWYIALGLAIAAVVAAVLVTVRSRTHGMIGLTVAMTVLLVAVVLTYPTDSKPCTPTGGQNAATNPAADDLGDGIQLEDEEIPTDATTSPDDCE